MDADTNTDIKLRNMTSIYISCGTKILLLYRIGSRVVPPSWCGIGGHFEPDELNDPRTCVLRELEEENRRLLEENTELKSKSLKESFYDHIHVSVRTMDIIIGCLCVLFVVVLILGMSNR